MKVIKSDVAQTVPKLIEVVLPKSSPKVEETEQAEETNATKASETTSTESKESDSAKGKITRDVANEGLPRGKATSDDLSLKADSLAANFDGEVDVMKSAVQASLPSVVVETNLATNPMSAVDLGKPPVQAAPRNVVKPTETKLGIADSLNAVRRSPLNVNLPAEVEVRFRAEAFSCRTFRQIL